MRIVQLNLAWDAASTTPEGLLDRFHTLTGWSDALTSAGATVHVVQRFALDATVVRDGVTYEFIADGEPAMLPAWSECAPALAALQRAAPDVVHINGLMFPAMVRAARAAVSHATVLVLQDHSGAVPRRLPWPFDRMATRRWRQALDGADASSFTAAPLAERWHRAGLPRHRPVLEIPEASTRLRAMPRHAARARSNVTGSPAILWVGRLDANKDPLTVLDGLDAALPALPDARLTMVVPAGTSQDEVRRRVAASTLLSDRVALVGPVEHADMEAYYAAADVFVSGSRHEGSGYALIEAMACGVVPCVTDIPAFRALTGDCGARWPVGDATAFASALWRVLTEIERSRAAVRRRFAAALTWDAIGRRTFDAYEALLLTRRAADR